MVAGGAQDLGFAVERLGQIVAFNALHERRDVTTMVEEVGLELVGQAADLHLVGAGFGGQVVHGLAFGDGGFGQGDAVLGGQLAGHAQLVLFGGHLGGGHVADAAPLVVTLGSDDLVAAGAFAAFLVLLFVAAHTALGRDAILARGNLGGVHGALKVDEVALGFAFHGMTGATGHHVARVMTGRAIVDLVDVSLMVECHRRHAGALGIGLFADRKENRGIRHFRVGFFQTHRHSAVGFGKHQTGHAGQGNHRRQKQCFTVPHVLVLLKQTFPHSPAAWSRGRPPALMSQTHQ